MKKGVIIIMKREERGRGATRVFFKEMKNFHFREIEEKTLQIELILEK